MRIKQLPSLLANQIAAGEVIERPASIVKELLENALDAGASRIDIDIGFGGLNHIKISDNGAGIMAEDLPLAIAAHATSKISCIEDLYAVKSMGFRGEALASIASVTRLSIQSKPPRQNSAMSITVNNNQISLLPCAHRGGTTIDARDIFFNAPVRKKFLKSEQIEFQAIEQVVRRFALSSPEIHIQLKHNDKVTLEVLPASSQQSEKLRIQKIIGKNFIDTGFYLEDERGTLRISGYLGHPEQQRSQQDKQYFYLNQRMVKDKLIQHAMKQAFAPFATPGRHPLYLLYLNVPVDCVDVNVHPTKHEVRFQDPRLIHDFIVSAVQALLNEKTVAFSAAQPQNLSIHEPAASYESFTLKQAFSPEPTASAAWQILNENYALVGKNNERYLIDLQWLSQHYLQHLLHKTPRPWSKRPLLIPLSISVHNSNNLTLKQHLLAEFGIDIHWSASAQAEVRSIPVAFPYINIKALLEWVFAQDTLDMEQVNQAWIRFYSFDSSMINNEEQQDMMACFDQVLRHSIPQGQGYRALGMMDCRMFIYG